MNKLIASSILLAAMVPVGVMAQSVPQKGTQEVTLSGGGSSDKDFDSTVFAVNGSWGQYLNESGLWGIRQTVGIRDNEDDSTRFDGATRIFYDHHFGSGPTRPFVGVSLGGIYGEGVDDTFSGGPEIGLKHYLKEDVFVTAMVEYQFLFDSGSEAADNYDDGALYYNIGLGYNF